MKKVIYEHNSDEKKKEENLFKEDISDAEATRLAQEAYDALEPFFKQNAELFKRLEKQLEEKSCTD